MTALIAIETVVLALLAVLVVGLLRSHAEILRRMEELRASLDDRAGLSSNGGEVSVPDPLAEPLPEPRERDTPAYDIVGETLGGDAVQIAVGSGGVDTLLAFLSSGCGSCLDLWGGLRSPTRAELPTGARLVVVTKDASHESSRKLRELSPDDVPVVMSSAAWTDYDVPHSPYFIFVEGEGGRIAGEGSARRWDQVLSLLGDALEDESAAQGFPAESRDRLEERPPAVRRRDGEEDVRRADDELRRSGIGPDHPSLYEP